MTPQMLLLPRCIPRLCLYAQQLSMSAIMNFIGALMSEKVAMTIASGLVDIQLQLYVIFAALMGAIVWDLFTWWFSIPSSSSHALIGSLIGATIVFTGSTGHILWAGVLEKVVIPLFTSPLIGMALGYFIMKLVFEIFAEWPPKKANWSLPPSSGASQLRLWHTATAIMTLRRPWESSRWR